MPPFKVPKVFYIVPIVHSYSPQTVVVVVSSCGGSHSSMLANGPSHWTIHSSAWATVTHNSGKS